MFTIMPEEESGILGNGADGEAVYMMSISKNMRMVRTIVPEKPDVRTVRKKRCLHTTFSSCFGIYDCSKITQVRFCNS